jgi:hypothetical protein
VKSVFAITGTTLSPGIGDGDLRWASSGFYSFVMIYSYLLMLKDLARR